MLTAFGGYEKIKLQQVPKPQPREEHVIIEVKACGLNFSDLYIRQGVYTFHGIKPPFIMGSEAAGIISEVGGNVTAFKVSSCIYLKLFEYYLHFSASLYF